MMPLLFGRVKRLENERPALIDLLLATTDEQHVLAVLTFGGQLSLIKGFDDVHPCYATTDGDAGDERRSGPLLSPVMEWNNDGELLCLAGHYCSSGSATSHHVNVLHFYSSRGVLRYRIDVPYTQVIFLREPIRLTCQARLFYFHIMFSRGGYV